MLRTVQDALKDIETPILEVWNKSDLLTENDRKVLNIQRSQRGDAPAYLTSCYTGEGIEDLRLKIYDVIAYKPSVVPGHRKQKALEVHTLELVLPLPLEPSAWTFLHRNATITATLEDCIEVQFPSPKTKAQYNKLFG